MRLIRRTEAEKDCIGGLGEATGNIENLGTKPSQRGPGTHGLLDLIPFYQRGGYMRVETVERALSRLLRLSNTSQQELRPVCAYRKVQGPGAALRRARGKAKRGHANANQLLANGTENVGLMFM